MALGGAGKPGDPGIGECGNPLPLPFRGLGVGGKCAYRLAVCGGDVAILADGRYGDETLEYGEPSVAAVGKLLAGDLGEAEGPNDGECTPSPAGVVFPLPPRYGEPGAENPPPDAGVPG